MRIYDASFKKLDRKTIEKNRRNHMKYLCYNLHSLVPSLFLQPFKAFTQENQFDHSIAYIEKLQKRIKELKDRRNEALRLVNDNYDDVRLQTVEVKEVGSGLQVFFTSSSLWNYSLSKVISILEDGGAEVVKGGYTAVDDKFIYTLHAEARVQRIGIDMTSIHEKLQKLINCYSSRCRKI